MVLIKKENEDNGKIYFKGKNNETEDLWEKLKKQKQNIWAWI